MPSSVYFGLALSNARITLAREDTSQWEASTCGEQELIGGAIRFLVLSGPAVGVDRTDQDPQDNWTYALDITSVLVSDATSGLRVDIDEQLPGVSQDELGCSSPATVDRSNYYFGADYALRVIGTVTLRCAAFTVSGMELTSLSSGSPMHLRVFGTSSRSAEADGRHAADFEFWIQSFWTPPAWQAESDRAPNSGLVTVDPTPPNDALPVAEWIDHRTRRWPSLSRRTKRVRRSSAGSMEPHSGLRKSAATEPGPGRPHFPAAERTRRECRC